MPDAIPTRCAVCQLTDGLVVNVIVAAPSDAAPDGCGLVELMAGMECDIGWTWDGAFGFMPGVSGGN